MKKIFVAIIALILMAGTANALDVSSEVYMGFGKQSDAYSVKTHAGTKITVAPDSDNSMVPYAFASFDVISTRLEGLNGPEYHIAGAGLGLKYAITDYLTLFGDVGYFHPMPQNLQNFRKDDGFFTMEGVAFFLNHRFAGTLKQPAGFFDEVHVEAEGAFGGELGFKFQYPVASWMTVDFSGAYRLMRMDESIIGRKDRWTKRGSGYWQYKTMRDLSGPRIGLGMTLTW